MCLASMIEQTDMRKARLYLSTHQEFIPLQRAIAVVVEAFHQLFQFRLTPTVFPASNTAFKSFLHVL